MQHPNYYIEKFWDAVGDRLCRITHLDNFTMAYVLTGAFGALALCAEVLRFQGWWWASFDVMCGVGAVTWIAWVIRMIQRDNSGDKEVFILSRWTVIARFMALYYTWSTIFFMVTDLIAWKARGTVLNVAFLCASAALFLAIRPIPKRHSRTKATIKQIREAVAPKPTLVPARVG